MAGKKQNNRPSDNNRSELSEEQLRNRSLNNKATRLACGSLHKRGVTLEQLATDNNLIITLSVMTGAYYCHLDNRISIEERNARVMESWNKYLESTPV